jgi:hypothetical protein
MILGQQRNIHVHFHPDIPSSGLSPFCQLQITKETFAKDGSWWIYCCNEFLRSWTSRATN